MNVAEMLRRFLRQFKYGEVDPSQFAHKHILGNT